MSINRPSLPSELILAIVDCIIPSSYPQPIAIPPSHLITKTLLSLTQTSRIIYPTARRLLYTHCLYLDNQHRLRQHGASIDSLTYLFKTDPLPRSLPDLSLIQHMTSLYLSPYLTSIDNFEITHNVQRLLTILRPSLRHLVIDIPLRSLHTTDDWNGIRPILRSKFKDLTALETFCSVRDELYLDTIFHRAPGIEQQYVWSFWPNLKTLALYNQDITQQTFWTRLAEMKKLEILVLTRSDGLEDIDIKAKWREHFEENHERCLDILLVNVESHHPALRGRERWQDNDKVKIRELNVPTSYYGDEDVSELCQEWVKRRMLRNENPIDWT